MDVHCTNCGEPWDTYHLRHDAPQEAFAHYAESDKGAEAFYKQWCAVGLTPEYRQLLEDYDGWQFGASVVAVHHCPCCESNIRQNGPRTDSQERRDAVDTITDLLGDDVDGAAAMLEDFGL